MKAFHNDPKIKEFYLARVRAHRLADEIVKGQYWQEGKGCAVGCTIHGNDHDKYEKELGISRVLATLEDEIFENIPNDRAKLWPEEFLSAIKVGADLSDVWPKFAVWLLTDDQHGVIKYAKTEQQKLAVQAVSDCYSNYKNVTRQEWCTAANAAYATAYDALLDDGTINTAYYAAKAAYYAADNDATYADADAAAADAAAADAYAAASADAAFYAATAADTDHAIEKARLAQADKILELLREQR